MPVEAASPATYLTVGRRAYEQEDWLAAVAWLEAAAAHPDSPAALAAPLDNDDDDEEEAKQHVESMDAEQDADAYTAEPFLATVFDHLAFAAFKAGDLERAISATAALLAFDGDDRNGAHNATSNNDDDKSSGGGGGGDSRLADAAAVRENLDYYKWLLARRDGPSSAAKKHRAAAGLAQKVHDLAPVDNILQHNTNITTAVARLCRGESPKPVEVPPSSFSLAQQPSMKLELTRVVAPMQMPARSSSTSNPSCFVRRYGNPMLQWQPLSVEWISSPGSSNTDARNTKQRKQQKHSYRGESSKGEAEDVANESASAEDAWTGAVLSTPAEEQHDAPGVVMFRNFLTDAETELLLQVAQPKMARSVAFANSEYKPVNFRTSQVAWLNDNDDTIIIGRTNKSSSGGGGPGGGVDSGEVTSTTTKSARAIVRRINKRIEWATRLDMAAAEQLQVNNYGIGGHYEPHYDWSSKADTKPAGNRLATFMIYLSDVAAGGYTAFPHLGVSATPRKNDAIFWYNLKPEDGTGEGSTLHAGCPVLEGTKWVANKWIHQGGNRDVCYGPS